ncbi:MAG: hypothetical protein OXI96_04440 [Acidimicrobiaceae bacterium]|nr:hypothetical protein [Acidimicrobiaceae bacterium]
MKILRVLMTILVVPHLVFACLTALVGGFADGGTIPERILLSLVHPLAAVFLLVAVVSSKPLKKEMKWITLALLSVNILGDIVVAVLIGQGVIKGDWSLPLVFAIVPLIGAVYITTPVGRPPMGGENS